MAKPLASLPSFSNFAKVSSPFFPCASYSFIESSERLEGREEELPMMAEVVAQAQNKVLPRGLVMVLWIYLSLLSLFLPFFSPF